MTGSLAGKRVLIVEDEYLIAHDLKRALNALDAEVVGPVANMSAAFALAGDTTLDAAVLDINLCGAMSYPVADRLVQGGIPHVFVTGYDDWAMPEGYRATPRVSKPFATGAVTDWVERLCAPPQA